MLEETDDAWGEDEFGDEAEDDSTTVECPHCKEEIYEDAEQCPYCRQYVTPDDVQSNRRPMWIVITAVVCIYAMLHFYISALFFG